MPGHLSNVALISGQGSSATWGTPTCALGKQFVITWEEAEVAVVAEGLQELFTFGQGSCSHHSAFPGRPGESPLQPPPLTGLSIAQELLNTGFLPSGFT